MKTKTIFVCSNCGYESSKWLGKCPACNEWNSFYEEKDVTKSGTKEKRKERSEAIQLNKVEKKETSRIKTGIEELDRVVYDFILIFGLVGVFLALLCTFKYRKKVKHAKIIKNINIETNNHLKDIEKEEEATLSVNSKCNHIVLCNLDFYEKRRKTDLNKIKKISNKKTSVCELFIILMVILSVLPILEFGLSYAFFLLKIEPFVVYFNHIRLNIISLAMVILNVLLFTIFRRKTTVYYLIYLYIGVLILLSYLL
jgi:hypothetical protein